MKIRVKVRFLSYLKDMFGMSSYDFEFDRKYLLGEFIEIIKSKWPLLRKIDIEKEGPIIILLNGRSANFDDIVGDGDEITVIPPATGG